MVIDRSTKLQAQVPTISGSQFAGAEILSELPGHLGLLAFRVLRSLHLWTGTPPEARRALFHSGSMDDLAIVIADSCWEDDAAISRPLVLIACELGALDTDLVRLALGCLTVCDGALTRNAFTTALSFSDAAASIAPSARYALVAGRMHRQHGSQDTALMWLRQASALASRVGDWETKAKALLSIGSAQLATGRYGAAEEHYQHALRIAKRYRLREQIGETYHDLFMLSIATAHWKAADAAMEQVVRHYTPRHHRLPAFAHDLAVYFMERGHFDSARLVLLPLTEYYWLDELKPRLLAHGSALRAVGACSRIEEFDRLHGEFSRLVEKCGEMRVLAPALVAAAQGAMSLGRWRAAHAMLTSAMEHAKRTGQHDMAHAAEELLMHVGRQRQAPRRTPVPSGAYAHVAQKTVTALEGRRLRA